MHFSRAACAIDLRLQRRDNSAIIGQGMLRWEIIDEGAGKVRLRLLGRDRGLGIYKMDRGRLYVCVCHLRHNCKRPTSFRPGPGEELWVLQRPGPKK